MEISDIRTVREVGIYIGGLEHRLDTLEKLNATQTKLLIGTLLSTVGGIALTILQFVLTRV